MNKPTTWLNRPRVALLIESSRAYGRGTLSGVAKYIREHGHWSVFLQEHSLCDDVPAWLENWGGDGIITRMENQAMANVLRRLRVPTVYLREVPPNLKFSSVLTDNAAVSRFAFEHHRESRGTGTLCGRGAQLLLLFCGLERSPQKRGSERRERRERRGRGTSCAMG